MRLSIVAYGSFAIAVALWAAFGALVWQLGLERAAYAEGVERTKQESIRGESTARLRASVQGTEAERAALESLVQITILQAVEAVEQAGEVAGASNVEIGEASPSTAPEGFSAVMIVVNASGSFAALTRAVSLFETLPIPAKLQQFELVKAEQQNAWRLTARLNVLTQ
jgi:hypothetical protein